MPFFKRSFIIFALCSLILLSFNSLVSAEEVVENPYKKFFTLETQSKLDKIFSNIRNNKLQYSSSEYTRLTWKLNNKLLIIKEKYKWSITINRLVSYSQYELALITQNQANLFLNKNTTNTSDNKSSLPTNNIKNSSIPKLSIIGNSTLQVTGIAESKYSSCGVFWPDKKSWPTWTSQTHSYINKDIKIEIMTGHQAVDSQWVKDIYYNLYCIDNGKWENDIVDQIHIQYQANKYNHKYWNCVEKKITTPYFNNANLGMGNSLNQTQIKKIKDSCDKFGLESYLLKKNNLGEQEYACSWQTQLCRWIYTKYNIEKPDPSAPRVVSYKGACNTENLRRNNYTLFHLRGWSTYLCNQKDENGYTTSASFALEVTDSTGEDGTFNWKCYGIKWGVWKTDQFESCSAKKGK